MLEEEVLLIQQQLPLSLLYSRRPEHWQELTPQQQRVTLMHFSNALATMLTSGVPTRMLLQTASALLPAQEAHAIVKIAEGDLANGIASPLGAVGVFPPSFRLFLTDGEA